MILAADPPKHGVAEDILQAILQSPYEQVFQEVARNVVKSCLGIAALFMLIMIAFHIGRQLISRDHTLNLSFLPSYFFLMLALTAYIPLMTTIINPIIEAPEHAMRQLVRQSSRNGQQLEDVFRQFEARQAEARKDEGFLGKMSANGGGIGGAMAASMGMEFREMFFKLANYVIDFLFDLVSFIIFLIRFYALGILFSIGPVAITFSFLKPLSGSLNGWAKYYLVVHLWVLIIYIIDFASAALLQHGLASASAAAADDGYALLWQMLLVKSGLIIVKVLTPKFADILISGSQGGLLFSAVSGVAMKAFGQAIGGLQEMSTARSSPGGAGSSGTAAAERTAPSAEKFAGQPIQRNGHV